MAGFELIKYKNHYIPQRQVIIHGQKTIYLMLQVD